MIKKLKSSYDLPIAVATIFATALLALAGLGFVAPTGEQSKLQYNGNIWCVSNFLEEEENPGFLPDGRPIQDHRLKGKEDWIRREQVEAQSKAEAEKQVEDKYKDFFARSNKDEMRAKLDANDKDFFTHHFNEGATEPGPCWGTGEVGNDPGQWIGDAVRSECFGQNPSATTPAGSYKVIKEIEVNVTMFSPNTAGNNCDKKAGGLSSADGGFFKDSDGKIKWHKGDRILDHIFAEPTTNNIIPWDKISQQAIVIPGFLGNQPVEIHDHYQKGVHANDNYLDLLYTCGEGSNLENQLKAAGGIPAGEGTRVKVQIVDLTQPVKAAEPVTPVAKPKNPRCPDQMPEAGPTAGGDHRDEIAQVLQQQLNAQSQNSGGGNNTPLKVNPTGNKIADVALSQVGFQGDDDKTKYSGGAKAQWCAYFATWVYRQAGYDIPSISSARETLDWFDNHGHQTFKDPSQAQPGDIVVWKRPDDSQGHIGIVVANDGGKITTVEGNTSGDRVAERTYNYDTVINKDAGLYGFGRW